MLELTLLGGFDARTPPGDRIALPTRKARALLAYLALHPDQAISRQSLAALLWSDRAEPQANNSLSQAVTALRKALADADPMPLVIETDSLRIAGGAVDVDVRDFERLSASGDLEDLTAAENLYRGALLENLGVRDPAFEDWLETERRRLHALAVETVTKLLERQQAEGQQRELVPTAERLLQLDPLHEPAHRALMRFYAREGQVGLALAQYDRCAETLEQELGVEPSEETRAIRDAIVQRKATTTGEHPADSDQATAEVETGHEPTVRTPQPSLRKPTALAALVFLLCAGALGYWFATQKPGAAEPSIVVLPFTTLSGGDEQQSFADGMTEELITGLSKAPGLFVISRNTTMAYKGRDVRPREVAGDLDVRYVLEGSVRRAADRLRINARLTDATSEGNVWADSFEGSTADIFALQDEITERIVDALALELLPRNAGKAAPAGTDNVAALDAFNLGRFHYYRRTPEDNARAEAYFRKALELDPDYSAAYTSLAKVYVRAALGEQAYAEKLGVFWTEGFTRAERMLAKGMTQPNADTHVVRSWLALRKLQYDQAISEAESALALNPNDAEALEALAEGLIYAGQPLEGIARAQKAMAQNPLLLGRPLFLLGLAEFARGEAAKAVDYLERAIQAAPARKAEFSGPLAAALGELGRGAEAEAAFTNYQKGLLNRPAHAWSVGVPRFRNPRSHTWWHVDLAWAVYDHPFASEEVLERFALGLKTAGATSGIGGFLPLTVENRLSGEEIRDLLTGATITGSSIWPGSGEWREERDATGAVTHSGYAIHPGLAEAAKGKGRIDGDRLCERWSQPDGARETCVVVYRLPDPKTRIRWGSHAMITDTGPHPFSVIQQ